MTRAPGHHEVTCGDANERFDAPQAQLLSAAPQMRVDSCEPNFELARHVARRHHLSQAAEAFLFAVGEQCSSLGIRSARMQTAIAGSFSGHIQKRK